MRKKEYSPRKTLIALVFLAVLVFYPYLRAAQQPKNYAFGGETMGTTYNVRVARTRLSKSAVRKLHDDIEELLVDINRQMSTYDPESEISNFNASTETNAFSVSRDFVTVTETALKLAHQSNGAFDPTVMPLVSLWGFGPDSKQAVPTADAIASIRDAIGFMKIRVTGPGSILKTHPSLSLDLNAAAKGYASDRVARLARDRGCPNVFVEIGGEIMALGHSDDEGPWRVSIDRPRRGTLPGDTTQRILEIQNRAVATSGDYRNYYEDQGRVYSHIIDPRSGYPVSNRVASTTVIAADCLTADALATALMVLGPDEGQPVLEAFAPAEAMWIVREGPGRFAEHFSPGFPKN